MGSNEKQAVPQQTGFKQIASHVPYLQCPTTYIKNPKIKAATNHPPLRVSNT